MKKPRLGRGLDALIPSALDTPASGKEVLRQLPVDLLQRGRYQPRTHMRKDALNELADSIRAQGVVQPILVRELTSGDYEIIAGERRWRAAQLAGLDKVPAVVRKIPDEAAMAIGLIENIQRENLNPVEEASALQRLIDEFGMTHKRVAEAVGRSRAAVSNLLRLLTLNPQVREMVEKEKLDMGHARALLALEDNQQLKIAQRVVDKDLSVRATEDLVRRLTEGSGDQKRKKSKRMDPDIRRLQDKLSDKLGTTVVIRHGKRGKGQISIEYHSVDELEGILKHIR